MIMDSKAAIKYLCGLSGVSMAELVRRRNELHPTDKTTQQNLSNKLSRDSLRFTEFIELANCVGYNISFEPNNADNKKLIESAENLTNYYDYHNKNLTKKQYELFDEMKDILKDILKTLKGETA